jgi:hypothetical protein
MPDALAAPRTPHLLANQQPAGNCKWVTLVQAVGTMGKRIPPFIIFAGKVLISTWFELGIPCDWVIQVSPNGWTSNNLALDWLKHFDMHAKPLGAYRLLIIDSHKSHCLLAFQDYCKENKIIALHFHFNYFSVPEELLLLLFFIVLDSHRTLN